MTKCIAKFYTNTQDLLKERKDNKDKGFTWAMISENVKDIKDELVKMKFLNPKMDSKNMNDEFQRILNMITTEFDNLRKY